MDLNQDNTVSPVIAIVLMVILAAVFPIIFYSFLGGATTPLEKSPYIAIETEVRHSEGLPYIEIRHKGGDTTYLNDTGVNRRSSIDLFITREGDTIRAIPEGFFSWGPGESLFMYNTPEGPQLTKDRTVALSGIGCLPGERTVTAVHPIGQMFVFRSNVMLRGIAPDPLLPPPLPHQK
jgi:hypothetical protein